MICSDDNDSYINSLIGVGQTRDKRTDDIGNIGIKILSAVNNKSQLRWCGWQESITERRTTRLGLAFHLQKPTSRTCDNVWTKRTNCARSELCSQADRLRQPPNCSVQEYGTICSSSIPVVHSRRTFSKWIVRNTFNQGAYNVTMQWSRRLQISDIHCRRRPVSQKATRHTQ